MTELVFHVHSSWHLGLKTWKNWFKQIMEIGNPHLKAYLKGAKYMYKPSLTYWRKNRKCSVIYGEIVRHKCSKKTKQTIFYRLLILLLKTISNRFDNSAITLSSGWRANSRGSVPLIRRMNEFLKPGLHCGGKTTSIPISGFDTAKMAEPNIKFYFLFT